MHVTSVCRQIGITAVPVPHLSSVEFHETKDTHDFYKIVW